MKCCVCWWTSCVRVGGGGCQQGLRGIQCNCGVGGGGGGGFGASEALMAPLSRWNGWASSMPSINVSFTESLVFCFPLCRVTSCASTDIWCYLHSAATLSFSRRSFCVDVFCSSYAAALLSSSACLCKRSCSFLASAAVRWPSSSANCVLFSSISVSVWFIHPGMSAVRLRMIVKISVEHACRCT